MVTTQPTVIPMTFPRGGIMRSEPGRDRQRYSIRAITADETEAQWIRLRSFLIASSIKLEDEGEVRTYTRKHRDLMGATADICKKARGEFGEHADLILRLYRDPEIEDEYLVLYVRLSQYGNDTLKRIRSITESFSDVLCNATGSILVTTDFRRRG
jgi:hypothetical protein